MSEFKYLVILLVILLCPFKAISVPFSEEKKETGLLEKQLDTKIALIKLSQYINIDTAFVILKDAKRLAEKLKDKTELTKLYIAESELLCRVGKLEAALNYANKAKLYAEDSYNRQLLADSYLAIAGVYLNLDDYESAYDYCLMAEPVLVKQESDEGLRKCYANLGSIYNRTGNIEKASVYFTKSLQYAEKEGNLIYIAIACNNLGIVCNKKRQFDESEKYLIRAVRLSEENNYNTILVTAYINLANLMLNKGKNELALGYCENALKLARRFELKDGLLRVYLMNGRYFYNQKEYAKSIENTLRSLKLSIDSKNYNEVILSAILLTDGYQAMGKPDSGLYYLKYALLYKDSLNMRNNVNNLIKLQYEFTSKEEQQKAKFRMIKIALWILLFVLILLIIAGTFILKARKKQLKIFELETKSAEMEQQLGCKNRELTSKLMLINSSNNMLESLVDKLTKVKSGSVGESSQSLDEAISDLKYFINSAGLKEFELRFNEVHPEFMKHLLDRFPNLTSNEKNLCAYLKLNMSTKEIASLLHVSVNAIIIARYRLRKKLKLNNTDISITQFLDQL